MRKTLKLVEKANIDWNNYLTKEEVKQFLAKDDKIESAENIIYSNEFKPRYQDLHNDLQKKYNNSWTKKELVKDLADFYYSGHLIESIDTRENDLQNIRWIKSLLGQGFNIDNYKDKSDEQVYNILKSYKDKYNKSGKILYTIHITTYSKDSNSGISGYLVDSDEITEVLRQATLFSSKSSAEEYFNDYTLPHGHTIVEYSIDKLKF